MIRDLEIQRLINYAKGLGLKVTFTSKDRGASALWNLDNTGIEICKKYNKTKIETVLSLIHELGHSLHNIYEKDRKIDQKFVNAINHTDEAEELEIDSQRRQRKILLNNEIAGTLYWENIYKETDMKFPLWKLRAASEFDIWQYQFFYETGDYPFNKEKKEKRKEIQNKHRDINE